MVKNKFLLKKILWLSHAFLFLSLQACQHSQTINVSEVPKKINEDKNSNDEITTTKPISESTSSKVDPSESSILIPSPRENISENNAQNLTKQKSATYQKSANGCIDGVLDKVSQENYFLFANSSPTFNSKNQNAFLIPPKQNKVCNENEEPILPLRTNHLVNDHYLNLAKRSYSLQFNNSSGSKMGTAWILDYQLTNDDSYPLTWYFATNAHVAQNLKVRNDYLNYGKFEEGVNQFKNTEDIKLFSYIDPKVTDTPLPSYATAFSFYNEVKFEMKNGGSYIKPTYGESKVKTIFNGLDFLNTSPSEFSDDPRWKGVEEFADFAVLEITFANAEIAKKTTNNYVGWKREEQFQLPSKSLLYDLENGKKEQHYVLGYSKTPKSSPTSNEFDIVINKNTSEKNLNKGTRLAKSVYYGTFEKEITEGYSIFDGALNLAFFMPGIQTKEGILKGNTHGSESFVYWGLIYALRHDHLEGGASGSLAINQNYQTLGIQWGKDTDADFGFVQALKVEGFDYKNKYRHYNLPAYDLINGNVVGQKKSYREDLLKIKGQDFKTHLFPRGVVHTDHKI